MKTCEDCNEKMLKMKEDMYLDVCGELRFIKDVEIYKCEKCSNKIISEKEFERIEEILKK